MSLDARLSTIVEEASESLRTAIRDALSGALLNLPLPSTALQEIARRGYELGYREALASRGMVGAVLASAPAALAEAAPPDASAGVAAAAPAMLDDAFVGVVSRDAGPAIPTAPAVNGVSTTPDWEDDSDVEIEGEADSSAPASPAPAPSSDVGSVVDWSTLDEEPDPPNVADPDLAATSMDRPRQPLASSQRIFPHASVGTLRQRIVDIFDLGRFDIDVIICRKGDRARRQLKTTVKLSKYLVKE